MKETKSTCPYCGVGCGVIVTSEGDRITAVRGDPAHPANFGRLCTKGSTLHLTAAPELAGQARLLHPMVRDRRGAGDWRRAGWDEVLDRIVERMRAVGRLAVAAWTGHGVAANNYGVRLTGNLVRRFHLETSGLRVRTRIEQVTAG